MRLPRPLIALLLTASCSFGAPTTTPVPTRDAQAPLAQYTEQPKADSPAEAAAMQRRAGKKWPWIVAGAAVATIVIILIASGGGGYHAPDN